MKSKVLYSHVLYFTILFVGSNISFSQPVLPTPIEKNNFDTLTSYNELRSYLDDISRLNPIIEQKIIGKSVEGRDIPALFFSMEKNFGIQREQKPLVLIFCQQHGDEPSGKEAALLLVRDLTGPQKKLLENLDLILVPQLNPDGGELGQRRNASDMDLNRNHMILSEPETHALHQLFISWMPEVTLDVHEYGAISQLWMSHGFIKNADIQLGKVSNVNIDPKIYDFSASVFITGVGKYLKNRGFTFHEYLVGTPFRNSRIRYSTTAINDGRQSFGIYNTFSFIQEGIQYGNLTDKLEHRVKAQHAGLIAFLTIINQNAAEIKKIIKESRNTLLTHSAHKNENIAIQMDYYQDETDTSTVFPIFDLSRWQPVEQELKNFHSIVGIRKSVRKPLAYIIPKSEKELIEMLKRHRIEMNPLIEKQALSVESYQIKHVTSMIEEELEVPYIDVKVEIGLKEFRKGDLVVYLTQPAGNFIPLLLEPQSRFSLMQEGSGRKYQLSDYLKEDTQYPIYRLMEDPGFHQIKGEYN